MISQPLFNAAIPEIVTFDKVIRTKEEFLEAARSSFTKGTYLIDGEIEFTEASELVTLGGYNLMSGSTSILVFSNRASIRINILETVPSSQITSTSGLFYGFAKVISFKNCDYNTSLPSGLVQVVNLTPQTSISIFTRCSNLWGVSVTFSTPGEGKNINAFSNCKSLVGCYGRRTSKFPGSCIFYNCSYLSACLLGDSLAVSVTYPGGFSGCKQVDLSCTSAGYSDLSKGQMENCTTYVQKGLILKIYGGLE